MDLIYMPELLTYGSFRAPVYRDYEQPWNRDYFQYGKSSLNSMTRLQQEQLQQQLRASQKQCCQLCKENKRRSLGAYIRGKSRSTSCSEIHEEEEEVEEDDNNENKLASANDESNETEKPEENKNPMKSKFLSKLAIKSANK